MVSRRNPPAFRPVFQDVLVLQFAGADKVEPVVLDVLKDFWIVRVEELVEASGSSPFLVREVEHHVRQIADNTGSSI